MFNTMKRSMSYEVLDSLPTYGPMYVPISENGKLFYSEGFPVRFSRLDESSWVANSEPGWSGLNTVIELVTYPYLLIIAGGLCYVMDPNETLPIRVFGNNYLAVLPAMDNQLVLHDDVRLTIVDHNGDYYHTKRISFDGIKDLEIKDTLVSGVSYDPTNSFKEWSRFEFDLNTKTLTGGSWREFK
jgi:hypothetical protein